MHLIHGGHYNTISAILHIRQRLFKPCKPLFDGYQLQDLLHQLAFVGNGQAAFLRQYLIKVTVVHLHIQLHIAGRQIQSPHLYAFNPRDLCQGGNKRLHTVNGGQTVAVLLYRSEQLRFPRILIVQALDPPGASAVARS